MADMPSQRAGDIHTFGPYETEHAARSDASDIYALPDPRGQWRSAKADKIHDVCQAAGVETGLYDNTIIDWLAGWEPEVVQVVAGLITRAYAAGYHQGGGDR